MKFYTQYADRWNEALEEDILVMEGSPSAAVYENAYLLPLVKTDPNMANGRFSGGVVDSEKKFVAGILRNRKQASNWDCKTSYDFEEADAEVRDETVIFGGVIINHFGHLLFDSLVRFWYFCEKPSSAEKVVFLSIPDQKFAGEKLFELAGLPRDRYEFIERPTQFRQVIVPEQSAYFAESAAYPIWPKIYETLRANAAAACAGSVETYDKIYLTRTKLPKAREFNEQYFEQVFSENGYHIMSPETLPLEQQIYMIGSAKEIACTMGTLSHMAVFADKGIRLACILRNPFERMRGQMLINTIRELDACLIEGTKNLLPVSHPHGVFLFFGTRYFREYLDDYGLKYDPSQIDNEETLRSYMYDYLMQYADYYEAPDNYVWIRNTTALNVIDELNVSLYGRKIDLEALREKGDPVTQLRELRQKYEELEERSRLQQRYI